MTAGYQTILALVADHFPQTRTETEATLRSLGVVTIHLAETLDEATRLVDQNFLDLMIIGGQWRKGDPCDLIAEIRHGRTGPNPFMSILATTRDPDSPGARRPMRYGVDNVLPAPLEENVLEDELMVLRTGRKPFIVTSEYIGPDRRSNMTRQSAIPLFDVPNSLREKTDGTFDADATARTVASTMARFNIEKLERHAAHLVFLANRVGPDLLVGGMDEAISAYFEQMAWLGEDVIRRLDVNGHNDAAKSCQSLIQHLSNLERRKGTPPTQDVGHLIQLAGNIQNAISAASLDDATASAEPSAVASF